jgi:hypothetical protein
MSHRQRALNRSRQNKTQSSRMLSNHVPWLHVDDYQSMDGLENTVLTVGTVQPLGKTKKSIALRADSMLANALKYLQKTFKCSITRSSSPAAIKIRAFCAHSMPATSLKCFQNPFKSRQKAESQIKRLSVLVWCAASIFGQTNIYAQSSPQKSVAAKSSPYFIEGKFLHEPNGALYMGETKRFDIKNLISWNCSAIYKITQPERCASYSLNRTPVPIVSLLEMPGNKTTDHYGVGNGYRVKLKDGTEAEIWLAPTYEKKMTDGSVVKIETFDNLIDVLKVPWGNQPITDLNYNISLPRRDLSYVSKTSKDGQILWSYVYLLNSRGQIEDRIGQIVAKNPILSLDNIIYPKYSDFAFLRSRSTRSTHGNFKFGNLFIAIDLETGNLLYKHSNIKKIAVSEILKNYQEVLDELIQERQLKESDTILIKLSGKGDTEYRSLNDPYDFSVRIEQKFRNQHFK